VIFDETSGKRSEERLDKRLYLVTVKNEFMGYQRQSGRPGIRNYLLILNVTGLTEPTARRISANLPGSIMASTPYGMGMIGDDAQKTEATLSGLALNPNVGAVLILSADRSRCDLIMSHLQGCKKPIKTIVFDQVGHDSLRMSDEGMRQGAVLMRDISRQQRTPQPLSALFLGFECGLSDPTSGIAANPLLGAIADSLVKTGGAMVMGESLEWLGLEEVLAARAVNPQVAQNIRDAVLHREACAKKSGINLLGINPNRANIRAGLSTIEEKAGGSVAKSGSSPISAVLEYGQRTDQPGVFLMDAPSYTPESLTGFVAAGAQLMLFTTGVGNSYVSAMAPTIKISGNDLTAKHLPQQIDFDCSAIMFGRDPNDEIQRLLNTIIEVASGAQTFGEILGEGSEVISRFGPSL